MSVLNDDCNFIVSMVKNEMYQVSNHAIQRMEERKIEEEDIENIVIKGTFSFANFDKSKGESPRYMFSNEGKNAIIALTSENMPVVVTVYKDGEKNEML